MLGLTTFATALGEVAPNQLSGITTGQLATGRATPGVASALVAGYATDTTGRSALTSDTNDLISSLHDAAPVVALPHVTGTALKNMLDVVRRHQLAGWVRAFGAERLGGPILLNGGATALCVIPTSEVPVGSPPRRSHMLCDVKLGGQQKCRWVNDGRVRADVPLCAPGCAPNAPCALKESILILFALSAYFDWALITRDITKVHLQSYAKKRYYVKFDPDFTAHLIYIHDGLLPFDPSTHV